MHILQQEIFRNKQSKIRKSMHISFSQVKKIEVCINKKLAPQIALLMYMYFQWQQTSHQD